MGMATIPDLWTSYTPIVTANTGTYTNASASARYSVINKVCFLNFEILITTIGTGTLPKLTLPFPSANTIRSIGHAREVAVAGLTGVAQIDPNSTTLILNRYDNAAWYANGYRYAGSVAYEIA
jgi:hypothetical protein